MVRPKAPGDGPKRTRRASTPKDDDALRRKVRQHGATLIDSLIDIATSASSESTRLSAIKELLDRGYGKSFSSVERASSTTEPPPAPTLLIQPPSSSSPDHDTPQKPQKSSSTDPH